MRNIPLAVWFLLPISAASGQTGLARFNDIVTAQWKNFAKPEVEKRLPGELAALAPRRLGIVTLEKVDGVRTNLDEAPAVDRADGRGVALRLPGKGGWDLAARAHLKLEVKILGVRIVHRAPIEVDVTGFSARVEGVLDDHDAPRPRVDDAKTKVDFHLRLSSPDPLLGLAAKLATWVFEKALRGPVLAVLAEVVRQKLLPLVQGEPDSWGEGGSPPAAGPPTSLAARAREVDETIQRDMLPYGTLLPAHYSSPLPGQGTVTGWSDHGDSAIWTGHYLISQSFRHHATRDPAAKAGAMRALGGIDDLFEVTGGGGILARAVAPASSPDAQALLASGALHHRRTLRGVDTVGWGADFISRDQYIGAFAGMGFADLEFASDPAVRGVVRKNVSAAVNRFMAADWIVFFDDGRFSTSYASFVGQQLAIVALARRVDPALFDEPMRRYGPMAELAWFAPWTETWDPHGSYFKFNLEHDALALAMSVDQDPTRWREYHRALRVLGRALDHHENAWFLAVHAIVDPGARSATGPRIENALRLWCLRNERAVSVDPDRIRAIPTKPYLDKLTGGFENVAVHPVPIELRYISDFIWQRSPFGVHVRDDPYLRYPGLDLVLPYWIGRDLGLHP